MLICNHQLTSEQLVDLKKLTERCQASDGGLPVIYHHLLSQKRSSESNVFFYEKDDLIGFLSVYFFYKDACEISILIAPEKRRQGIACKLLSAVMPLLRLADARRVIFTTSTKIQKQWLVDNNFTWQHSEYHMERHSFETMLISNPRLVIQKAGAGDVDDLCELNSACFPENNINMKERFKTLVKHQDYTLLLAFYQGTVLGKAHLHWQEHETIVSDIAILPLYQGKGFGTELLSNTINHVLESGKSDLALDVETDNQSALNLYLRCGFKLKSVYEYWDISTAQLQKALNSKSSQY